MPRSTDIIVLIPNKSGHPVPLGGSILRQAITALGLPSDNTLRICCDDAGDHVGIAWEDLHTQTYLRECSIRLFAGDRVVLDLSLAPQKFPLLPSGLLWFPWTSPEDYLLTEITFDFQPGQTAPSDHAKVWERIASDYLLNQNPNDVRFTFAGTELELWVSSAVLKNASPYFETLVSGSFKEAQFTHVRDGRLMVSHITSDCDVLEDSDDDMDGNFDDSDDETDKVFKDQRRSLAKPRSRHVTPHKNVVVKDTAYTTYASVLLCLATRSIRFAQLRSVPEQTRLADLTAANEANPGLPLPASPKSVYRLAHLLELGDLRAVALDEFFSRLQVENAAVELFSDTAGVYPLLFANMRRSAATAIELARRLVL